MSLEQDALGRRIVLVDGNNVIGATAARGARWWRDRPAAVRQLLDRLRAHADATGARMILVLDGLEGDVPPAPHRGVEVVYATRRGRDAADDRIRELLVDVAESVRLDRVEVITSDRALAADARACGARVTGAGAFLARLDVIDRGG